MRPSGRKQGKPTKKDDVRRCRSYSEENAMKILATAAELNDELIRLIEECSSCQVAVAWGD